MSGAAEGADQWVALSDGRAMQRRGPTGAVGPGSDATADNVLHKVVAYITCDGHLLVFRQPDYPEAGAQVPGGTVAEHEDPLRAVLREAREETGLLWLKVGRYLGSRSYAVGRDGAPATIVHRRYYHLTAPGPPYASPWLHWETCPSEGPPEPIQFELRWVRMPEEVPDLTGALGDLLFEIEGGS